MSSPSKDITQASQPGSEPKNVPLVASPGEQDKQPANGVTSTPKTEGAAAQPAKVDAPAATTNTQAPVSTPPSSEKPPPSDPKPVPAATGSDTEPDLEKVPPAATTTPGGTPANSGPTAPVEDAQERRRKRRSLIIHTRLAKFCTWLLLLGFVIFPGTFSRNKDQGSSNPNNPASGAIKEIANLPLLAVGYACCFFNGCAISWLWYARKDDPEWLFTNLFAAGLVNAFSGLVTTFVNIYGVQDGTYGAATKSTLTLASACTVIYAVLTLVYHRKRKQARYRRYSRSSNV